MSDPRNLDKEPQDNREFRYDDRSSPSRRRIDGNSPSYMGWIVGAAVAVFAVGVLVYGLGDRTRTASNPPLETTGQSTRPSIVPTPGANQVPANPIPANPAPAPRPSANP